MKTGDMYEWSFRDQARFVFDAVDIINRVMTQMQDARQAGIWRIPHDDGKIVDCGIGTWMTLTDNSGETNKEDSRPVMDWACFWNPGTGKMVMDIMRSHVEGLDTLLDTNPGLVGQIKVSREVMALAERIHLYVISEENVNEDGDWIAPRRRLTTREWKEDL